MFRRTESIAERLMSNWLSIVLYRWVHERVSGPLYTLYRALKHQLEKGPIDAITYEAKYSLSEEKLLKENVSYQVLTVNVRVCLDNVHKPFVTQCRLLTCDSIGQVKAKILDHLVYALSNSPFWGIRSEDLDLLWLASDDETYLLSETDASDVGTGGGFVPNFLSKSGTLGKGNTYKNQNGEYLIVNLNTLQTYGIRDGSTLVLANKTSAFGITNDIGGDSSTTSSGVGDSRSPSSPRLSSASALLGALTMSRDNHNELQVNVVTKQHQSSTKFGSLRRYCSLRASTNKQNNRWDGKVRQDMLHQRIQYVHLVQPSEFRSTNHLPNMESSPKQQSCRNIPEIYLTRLLTTKGTLQKYVDDLYQAIFSTDCPASVTYLYHKLDEMALNLSNGHHQEANEIAYTWKCNSLPLRFLVNLIKNPDFVLDVEKPASVDSSLSVLGQLLMDSCSVSEFRLGKDSPTNKLLFAREISRYRSMVQQFMNSAQRQACPDPTEALRDFASLGISTGTTSQLSRRTAVLELYKYSVRYHMEILEALESQLSTRTFACHLTQQQAYSPSARSDDASSPSTSSSNVPHPAMGRHGFF